MEIKREIQRLLQEPKYTIKIIIKTRRILVKDTMYFRDKNSIVETVFCFFLPRDFSPQANGAALPAQPRMLLYVSQ